ncbi:TRAP transporter substrate-binding protein DctP [Hydrogenophaga sp. SL48]|uniref:TRAP transporter substrate-binding protein DctP n=1 Tax=Hydrogenophaga sp. SL48 TaxID=2806347 RepID=UPI001F0056F0|nr:TRAP transporter substrate-binding protein DctP [Hydrogenophaga sp. SL48]UJW82060.1 TRAP transporter substrate-binding protein DctP [Hydrogenophaga sp. SL48]
MKITTPLLGHSPRDSRRTFLQTSAGAAVAAGMSAGLLSPALAQAKPVILKAVIQHRNGESYKKWLWLQEQVKTRTQGRVEIETTTIGELGLGGTEMLRVLKSGVIDMAEILPGYVAGDFPLIEACDLPGISTGFAQSRKLYDAWTENVVGKNESVMGGKIMGSFCWSTMFMYTKFPLARLDDFKGKKIRVFAPAQARFLTALGGEPVSMTTADVYPSLQRGVIDGAITGTEHVKASSLWEVTKYMTNVNIPPMGSYVVIGTRGLAKVPAELRGIFTGMYKELSDLGWKLGSDNDQLGFAYALEKGMVLTKETKPEFVPQLTKISAEDIVPWWAGRAGARAKPLFNEFLSPIVGYKLS